MKPLVFVALSVLWGFGHAVVFLPTIYLRLACVAAFTLFVLRPSRLELSELLQGGPHGRAAGFVFGFLSGIVLIAGTYAAVHLSRGVWPELVGLLSGVYAEHGLRNLFLELPLLVLVVMGEEWLWRERGPRALSRSLGESGAAVFSILLYGLAQGGSGSVLVVAAALLLGTVWELMRRRSGSLLPPLVSHLMWSAAVLSFPLV